MSWTYCMTQGTLLNALWWSKWEGNPKKGGDIYMYTPIVVVEAETPILWPPDVKSWLIGKDPDAGKDWGQEEKGTTEDEMVGWHHRLNGHGFGWTLGVGDAQGGLVCCSSRVARSGTRLSDWTEQLIHFAVQQKLTQHCTTTILQWKWTFKVARSHTHT